MTSVFRNVDQALIEQSYVILSELISYEGISHPAAFGQAGRDFVAALADLGSPGHGQRRNTIDRTNFHIFSWNCSNAFRGLRNK